jgi:pimeloyl-ACP methyl ester carboxylesterase
MLKAVETLRLGPAQYTAPAGNPPDLYVPASDDPDRNLAVQISGSPSGKAVFFMHGTPGSRVGPLPRSTLLHAMGVQLISYDRPGYGRSGRSQGRSVADAADDVLAIADYLEIEKFAVLGRSGGGPHALACAARLPERVTRAGALVSLAPFDADGADGKDGLDRREWFDGMSDSNVREYTSAQHEPFELMARLVQATKEIKANPASHVAALGPEMPEADRRVVSDAEIRAQLALNFAEALRGTADGWIDDALAFCAPWGFRPSDITVPVLLWHGAQDVFSPVAHTLWLSEQIPGAITTIWPDRAHFDALMVVPDVLAWLIRKD